MKLTNISTNLQIHSLLAVHTSEVKPYSADGSKKEQVAEMFDNISERYDLLNHLLSLNIDKGWRNKAIKILKSYSPKRVLDIATGTADLAIAAAKAGVPEVIGADISEGMMSYGRKKVSAKNLNVTLEYGDSENLKYDDSSFDALMVAFGVRNFENLEKGLIEMKRVIKPGKPAIIIEFSKPDNSFFAGVYLTYFKTILPALGKLISKDSRAYTYLPESVEAFPGGQNFVDILEKCGYKNCRKQKLTFGIAHIYVGEK